MALGIDHPLVGVRDIDRARQTYISLGFRMRPPGRHPWGTSTALVIFRNQLLELVGIHDESLLDGYRAGGFRFGRHVRHWLHEREGVAISALHSTDAAADAAAVMARGGHCEGTIEFGRDVLREDGAADRTATTLKVFTRAGLPRLTMFACQQHRRDLIEFPEWMDHPNSAFGLVSATVLAEPADQPALRAWMTALYGADALRDRDWGFSVATGQGDWRVVSRQSAAALLGPLPGDLAADGAPSVISLDIGCRALSRLRPFIDKGGFACHPCGDALVLSDVGRLGGIVLSFCESAGREGGHDV